jgi:hypothetical protein
MNIHTSLDVVQSCRHLTNTLRVIASTGSEFHGCNIFEGFGPILQLPPDHPRLPALPNRPAIGNYKLYIHHKSGRWWKFISLIPAMPQLPCCYFFTTTDNNCSNYHVCVCESSQHEAHLQKPTVSVSSEEHSSASANLQFELNPD